MQQRRLADAGCLSDTAEACGAVSSVGKTFNGYAK